MKIRYYIDSFRLRTLPLSLSGVFMGSLLAAADGHFAWQPFFLAVLTTLSLQILSNLCNELGDMQKGTDNSERLGPIRSIQSGALSPADIRRCILIFVLLSAFSGTWLVYTALDSLSSTDGIVMLALGAAAIVAAIKYTVGKNAYGYHGLGDLFVYLFFGLLGVMGSYFLLSRCICPRLLLPASAVGFLSAGVLNLNNMRDIENDRTCGKRTLPVMLGLRKSKAYHFCLVCGAFLCMGAHHAMTGRTLGWSFLLLLPLFARHLSVVYRGEGRELDPQLKVLSLSTLAFTLLSGLF